MRPTLLAVVTVLSSCALLPACSSKRTQRVDPSNATPAEAPNVAPPAPTAPPVALPQPTLAPVAVPSECAAYRGVIDHLASCDRLPASTRDNLRAVYERDAATWAAIAADSPEGGARLAEHCATSAKAITDTVAATCGW